MLLHHAYPAAWVPMAMQCLNNEHIWAVTPEEEKAVKPDAVRFLMYAPFNELPAHLRADLPGSLRERFVETLEEGRMRSEFPCPAVNDQTASKVKEHYEENPFPRWFSTTVLQSMTVGQLLRLEVPGFSPPEFYEGAPKILVAGCGTGRETVSLALKTCTSTTQKCGAAQKLSVCCVIAGSSAHANRETGLPPTP